MGLRFEIGGGSVEFEDDLSAVDPYVFNGDFIIFSLGVSGGGGYGYSLAKLRQARQVNGAGAIGGISYGASEFAGSSEVVSAYWLSEGGCCE